MNSKENLNKPEFKNNLEEIIWSINEDIKEVESNTITMESLIQEKLQNSLQRYQEELDRKYEYILMRNETDNATVLKMMSKFAQDKENEETYEDSET